jgi:hypothetical protein
MTHGDRRLRTGKLPAQPARPHLRLAAGITSLPAPPAAVMYSDVQNWGLEGHDGAGDCVEAYVAHAVEQITRYATGTELAIPTAETINLYSILTGYDPRDPSTDQGTVMQDALSYWRKTGVFGGHRIAAFASVNLTDWTEIENAVNLFGHVSVGFNFPDSAMAQFNAGEPWTVVPGSPLDGGHCVMLVGYDADWLYVVTWGRVQKMARAFWSRYVDEAWAPITQEAINAHGVDAFGGVLDLAAMGAAFAALTHDPNPFPGPTPIPDPNPQPDPQPVEIDAVDRRLYDSRAFQRLIHHFADHELRRAAIAWVSGKGFLS